MVQLVATTGPSHRLMTRAAVQADHRLTYAQRSGSAEKQISSISSSGRACSQICKLLIHIDLLHCHIKWQCVQTLVAQGFGPPPYSLSPKLSTEILRFPEKLLKSVTCDANRKIASPGTRLWTVCAGGGKSPVARIIPKPSPMRLTYAQKEGPDKGRPGDPAAPDHRPPIVCNSLIHIDFMKLPFFWARCRKP